jgi:hypothetical protein
MLPVAPTNSECPGCVDSGQPHADWCDIQWCSVFDTGNLYSGCGGHDLTKANRRKRWRFRTGMDVEELFSEIAERSARSFVVNLHAALAACDFAGMPLFDRFDSFEEAKEYVVENLEHAILWFSCTLEEIRKANAVEELEISCIDLITEER